MSHLHPSYISPPSRSTYPCVPSIQIMSHLHPSPHINVSPPSRSRLNSIQVGHTNCSSAPSMSHLTQIQVSIYASHLDQCPVSPPSRSVNSRLTPIQVKSHIHPSPQICIARPSRSCLTSIKDRSHHSRLTSIQDASQLHPSHRILDLSSIQVPSHPNPGLKICVSPPSLPHLTFIQIPKFVCHLHPGRILSSPRLLNLGPDICVSPSPWRVPYPSSSRELYFHSLQVPFHPHPCLETCVSPPSRSHLNCI